MICKTCKKEIENGTKFCPHCGAKQTVIYTKVFENKSLGSKKIMDEINLWLAANPNVANVKCQLTTKVGFGFLVNHFKLKKVVLQYELFSGNNTMQYAITKKEKFRFVRTDVSKMVEKWKTQNPQASVVNWSGGTCSRGDRTSVALWGFGANNKMTAFILYKSPKNLLRGA